MVVQMHRDLTIRFDLSTNICRGIELAAAQSSTNDRLAQT
jgi:hypothetical protein